jgi:hypothetical protein
MADRPEPGSDLPEDPDEAAAFHRDRREHGGAPGRLDDDQLARLTEEERVEAGLDPYDPDEVPDAAPDDEPDIRETQEYEAEEAEIRREEALGELGADADHGGFPPTRYDDE